jgi:hypothetical protein
MMMMIGMRSTSCSRSCSFASDDRRYSNRRLCRFSSTVAVRGGGASMRGRNRNKKSSNKYDCYNNKSETNRAKNNTNDEKVDFVKENVDNAAKVLDEIIKEVVEQIFIDEAAEEVFDEVETASERLIDENEKEKNVSESFKKERERRKRKEREQMRVLTLQSVVRSKFDELDGTFLSVLGAYIKRAEQQEDAPLLTMLQAIKEETLRAVTVEMQPEMQVVQVVARLMRAEDRAEVLKIAHRGGGRAKCLANANDDEEIIVGDESRPRDDTKRDDYIPEADIDAVERAASQLSDEMELREVIPSWDLLYQIILARESARQMSPKTDKFGVYSDIVVSGAFAPSELPKAESLLIRNLVQIDDGNKRRQLLFDSMESARMENEKLSLEARKQREEGKIKLTKTTRGFSDTNKKGVDDTYTDEELMLRDLRPGRMIDCLINLRCSLLKDDRVKERGEQAIVAEKMAMLYFEACDLVLKNANGGVFPPSSSTNKRNSNSSNSR